MKRFSNIAYLSTLVFTLLFIFAACEKIDTESEEKGSISADISSEDIDKNKDKEDDNDDNGNQNGKDNNDKDGESEGGSENNEDNSTSEESDDTGYHTGDIISVSEFLKKDITCQIWVVGKIVGDCTRSKKYAEFTPPFTHSQAILLADNPNEKDIQKTISICLTTNKGMRTNLNLVDNPTNQNQLVAVFGYRENYLGLCGIKKPDGYKFPVNIK